MRRQTQYSPQRRVSPVSWSKHPPALASGGAWGTVECWPKLETEGHPHAQQPPRVAAGPSRGLFVTHCTLRWRIAFRRSFLERVWVISRLPEAYLGTRLVAFLQFLFSSGTVMKSCAKVSASWAGQCPILKNDFTRPPLCDSRDLSPFQTSVKWQGMAKERFSGEPETGCPPGCYKLPIRFSVDGTQRLDRPSRLSSGCPKKWSEGCPGLPSLPPDPFPLPGQPARASVRGRIGLVLLALDVAGCGGVEAGLPFSERKRGKGGRVW